MIKKMIGCLALMGLCHVCAAEYRFEANIGVGKEDEKSNGGASTWHSKSKSAELVWYFSPIERGDGPLQEAAFLNKSSSLKFSHIRENHDFDGLKLLETKLNILQLKTVIVDRVYMQLRLGKEQERDFTYGSSPSSDTFSAVRYGLALGGYLTQTSTLDVSVEDWSEDILRSADYRFQRLMLNYKNVATFATGTASFRASFGKVDNYWSQNGKMWLLGADWYFTDHLSLGVGLRSIPMFDSDKDRELLLSVNYFMSDKTFLTGRLMQTKQAFGGDEQRFEIKLGTRF